MLYLRLFINFLITLVIILVAIAFFTLLERKILGYSQLRKGPDKIALKGLLQPFADAIKLFLKQQILPSRANKVLFLLIPITSLFLAMALWLLYPHPFNINLYKYGILLFIAISGVNVYTPLIAGWASNSKYSLIGALRNRAQTISYEVRIALILLCPLICISSFNLGQFSIYSPLVIILIPNFFIWFITLLAETNRTPFDLAEGESELVSGFNTEYSAASFAFIFMAEYINILFISLLSAFIFFYTQISLAPLLSLILIILTTTIISIIFIWIRTTLPRLRYDQLISLCWKAFLPIALRLFISSYLIMSILLFVSFKKRWTFNSVMGIHK